MAYLVSVKRSEDAKLTANKHREEHYTHSPDVDGLRLVRLSLRAELE